MTAWEAMMSPLHKTPLRHDINLIGCPLDHSLLRLLRDLFVHWIDNDRVVVLEASGFFVGLPVPGSHVYWGFVYSKHS